MSVPLTYWDRYQNEIKEDRVYADTFIRFCYEHRVGKVLLDYFFSKRQSNILYGLYKNSHFSIKQIQKDIHDYDVDMELFKSAPFKSYSDFFLREFKDGKRPFPKDDNKMGAFCEGRYIGFSEITADHKYPVKGAYLTANALLGDQELTSEFYGGPIIISRLCPIDYHHFHFPDKGSVIKRYRIGGELHSVNVLALKNKGDIFMNNEREVTIIQTENFGKMAYIEVGAMCVGKIVQEDPTLTQFEKGQLKGHFEFGASTVIILGERGKWSPSKDILIHSIENRESFIQLGDEIAITN